MTELPNTLKNWQEPLPGRMVPESSGSFDGVRQPEPPKPESPARRFGIENELPNVESSSPFTACT